MKQIKHRTIGHDEYFLSKTVTRQWNQHATKQARATEHYITRHSQPQKMGSRVRGSKQVCTCQSVFFEMFLVFAQDFQTVQETAFWIPQQHGKNLKTSFLLLPPQDRTCKQKQWYKLRQNDLTLFFQAFISHVQLLKLPGNCDDQSSLNIFLCSERYSLALSCVCQEF